MIVILCQFSVSKPARGDEDPWLGDTYDALSRLANIAYFKSKICYVGDKPFDCYIQQLTSYLPKFENFLIKSKLNEKVYNRKMFVLLNGFRGFADVSLPDEIEQRGFLTSTSLKAIYDSTVKPLMETLKEDVATTASTDPLAYNGYALPLETACSTLPDREVPALSVKDVCPTLSQCSSSVHSSTANACSEEGNKCDLDKAIPLMIGVLFYKISFVFVDRFCSERCSGDGGCNMEEDYASIVKQIDLMKAFRKMLPDNPFDQFFRDAVTRRAYSRIGEAMEIISENEENFDLPLCRLACEEIDAEPGCQIVTFYPHYLLLKKMKEERLDPGHPGDTRDLTLYENVDHTKMIELKQDTVKHNEVLSAIGQLNDNLEVRVQGIASYFKGIASFDQGIAEADVSYLSTKLDHFNGNYTLLEAKVEEDVRKAMIAMTSLLAIQLVEQTIALVAKIAEESNPIAAIFTGVDTKGVRDQAVLVADAAAQVAHGVSLFANLDNLATDTTTIGDSLNENQKQITTLTALVEKIKNNKVNEIGDDAETFINEYAAYTPQVERRDMEGNIALWGAFRQSTCDLLNGVEGIGSSVGKGVANGFLLCEKLEGTIAEFDALRESIFEFQFELIDSLARVVRGNVAKKLADSIQQQQNDMFKADQLLGGFLMAQIFIQSQAWLYCDKLEYQNEGQKVQPCSPEIGLFTNNDLDNLVAFTDHQTYISIERTVHIPTKPQFRGDLGFINIHSFAKEKTASFRLPQDVNWLYKFDWSLIGETHAPYVENFQLFLPKEEYKTGSTKVKTSTRIVVTADTEAGSFISADKEKSVLYKLPEKQSSYITVYQEGYRGSTCSKEIPNPYSLCNNLPKVCHTSTNVAGNSLLPTTLSRWRVTYSVQSGEQEVDWLAPTSVTDLYLIAKVTLRMLPRKSSVNLKSSDKRAADQEDVCCEGNTYRSSLVSSECEDCPSESTSRLGGYYCEAESSITGRKKQHVFLNGPATKQRHSTKDRAFLGSKIRRPKGHPRKTQAHHSNK